MKDHQKHGFELQFLTDKQYVAVDGRQCPNCHKEALYGGAVEIDGGAAQQEVSCLTCGAMWLDQYKLTGYVDLELDTNQEQD